MEMVVGWRAAPVFILLAFMARCIFEFTSNIRQDVAYEQYGDRVLELRKRFSERMFCAIGLQCDGVDCRCRFDESMVKPQLVIVICTLL